MKGFISTAVVATTIALVGCTIHQTEAPALSGPSTFAYATTVSAVPDTVTQDGGSESNISVTVIGPNGRPVPSQVLRVDMAFNGVAQDFGTLSARSVVTNANGVASVVYTAPGQPNGGGGTTCNGLPGVCVQIVATPTGPPAVTDTQTARSSFAVVRLVPVGVILPPAGTPTASFAVSPVPVTQGTPAMFDASGSQPGTNASQITTYSWNFGDGTTATGKTATHTFTMAGSFNVTLTVTNDRNISASTSQVVTAAAATLPVANFVFSPSTPTTGQTVVFDGDQSTAAPGHQLTTFSWNFGDGATGSGLVASHVYGVAGTYNVVLSVVDDLGQKSTKSNSVPVAAAGGSGGSSAPTARFTISPATNPNPGVNQNVFFNASSSTAVAPHTILSYAWDFGDGVTGTGLTAIHAYQRAGTFTINLVVTDDAGQTGTAQNSVQVTSASSQIVAAFTFSPQDPTIMGGRNAVNFDATASSTTSPAIITKFVWVWGDGTPDTTVVGSPASPFTAHTFAVKGTYVVRLTVFDSTNASATTTLNVIVGP
jgi:PKD repeat protein